MQLKSLQRMELLRILLFGSEAATWRLSFGYLYRDNTNSRPM